MTIFNKIKKIIVSTFLCIKYPFLYPRNRFTGLHYNNWKLHRFWTDNYNKALVNIYTSFIERKYYNSDKDLNDAIITKKYKLTYEISPDHKSILLKNNNDVIRKIDVQSIKDIYKIGFTENEFGSISFKIFYDFDYIEQKFVSDKIIINRWLYIKMRIARFINDYVLQVLHCIPTHTEWDALKFYPGWYKSFGKQLLNDIYRQAKKDHMLYSLRIMDIKEKYGSLQIYINYGSKEMYNILSKYENISYKTCINCGKPAKYLSGGWICPYCEDCFDKDSIPMCVMDENGNWKETQDHIENA